MEIADKNTEKSTVIIAVMALFIVGTSLIFSTWQSVMRQERAEQEHLFLTSRAILLSVEHYLKRTTIRDRPDRLASRTIEFFEALESQGEIVFAGIFDPQGGGHLLTTPAHESKNIDIPLEVLHELFSTGTWHGALDINGRATYVYAKKIAPQRQRTMMHQQAPNNPLFLMVGISMEQHVSAHKDYMRSAIFQAGYILAAALLSWALGTSFLARREQVKRAAVLEKFQATLLDNLPDGLLTFKYTEQNMIVESANPAAVKILGKTSKTLLGKSTTALPQTLADYLKDSVSQEKAASWQNLAVQGAHLEVLLLPLSQPQSFMLIIRDRTKLRNLEKNLADAEKLAIVGTLATGVAHEIRNPLSALRGFAQYFVKKLAGQQPEETYAKTMMHEADRLNRVITDLLFLGRPKDITPEDIKLEGMIKSLSDLLRFDLEQKDLHISSNLECPYVHADAEGLKQALLNLLLNSIDALEAPTWAGKVQQDSKKILVRSYEEQEKIIIEVQDNGKGMTDEQFQKAFDPFFTSKGTGTGLGLSLVHATMLKHGGNVEIQSSYGKGCTVRLIFPQKRDS